MNLEKKPYMKLYIQCVLYEKFGSWYSVHFDTAIIFVLAVTGLENGRPGGISAVDVRSVGLPRVAAL